MRTTEEIINDVLLRNKKSSDFEEIGYFDEYYNSLEETAKSNLVRMLIGKGILKKDPETGKISGDKNVDIKKTLS